MAAINRLRLMVLCPLALGALTACTPDGDPAQTVERDADAQSVPAQQAGDAMQMQPARPAEAEVLPEAVDVQRNADGSVDVRKAEPAAVALRRTADGGVEIRKVDAAAGASAEAAPARAEPQH
ncbi:hypothetical protein [Stenotrophomonas maltophilia]|uniref:Secreted protein n=1 Tax=Stenotrophomonas maltophilia (strain R551-3) TaxID=391008 RepID=B4SLM9_STRM5|nr:hypothetical protein [Stenotrophomonas maltophilia]ACF50539.1 conserved hypothetical protein [Stenotrophomonas maltophilia R551-3]